MACECGTTGAGPPSMSKRLAGKTVPAPGLFSFRNFPGNPARLAAVPAGRAFFPGHGFEVGAMQRGCRPEAVEHDADGAAIAARANDDPFPAGEIWASRRAERAHPDAGRWRQPGRSSGGSAGDRDEPRAIAGLIYSAADEKRSVPNAWREIHRRTMRLTNAGAPEAIAAVIQGGSRSIRPSNPGCEPSRATTRSSPPGILPARVSLLSVHQKTDTCLFRSS